MNSYLNSSAEHCNVQVLRYEEDLTNLPEEFLFRVEVCENSDIVWVRETFLDGSVRIYILIESACTAWYELGYNELECTKVHF